MAPMKTVTICLSLSAAFLASSSLAFLSTTTCRSPLTFRRPAFVASATSSTMDQSTDTPLYFADMKESLQPKAPTLTPAPSNNAQKNVSPSKPKLGGAVHKTGILSPVVLASKMLLGDEKLNKIRAKAISMHGDIIKSFVDTSETALGDVVLKQLFQVADANESGTIDEQELGMALNSLGFQWLHEEQIKNIFQRADKDANGAIDLDEWIKEAPKTLKTNLVKLAKKNGGDMGLLV